MLSFQSGALEARYSDPVPSARQLARDQMTGLILEVARRHLAEVGPAALSLRAVARELEMSSSAVYRYVASRNDLLTTLLIAAFDEAGDAVEAGGRTREAEGLRARFTGLVDGLRWWAREHPSEYALAFGSPVPGYVAPVDTVAAYLRVPVALLTLVRDAQEAGCEIDVSPVGRPGAEALAAITSAVDPPLEDAVAVRAMVVWATLIGHLSLELFGHFTNGVTDLDAHWAQVVATLADDLGL